MRWKQLNLRACMQSGNKKPKQCLSLSVRNHFKWNKRTKSIVLTIWFINRTKQLFPCIYGHRKIQVQMKVKTDGIFFAITYFIGVFVLVIGTKEPQAHHRLKCDFLFVHFGSSFSLVCFIISLIQNIWWRENWMVICGMWRLNIFVINKHKLAHFVYRNIAKITEKTEDCLVGLLKRKYQFIAIYIIRLFRSHYGVFFF